MCAAEKVYFLRYGVRPSRANMVVRSEKRQASWMGLEVRVVNMVLLPVWLP